MIEDRREQRRSLRKRLGEGDDFDEAREVAGSEVRDA
jgi:hypothetical protein